MNAVTATRLAAGLLCLLASAGAPAQQDLEPGVQTSSAAAPAQPQNAQPPRTPAAAAAPTGTASQAATAAGASKPGATAPKTAPAAAGSAAGGAHSSDRIQLETTQISGNRELPRVMYVVPWHRPDPGDFNGRPLNSLLDEALTPVDRDVFRRQNRYFAALQSDSGSGKSQPASGGASPSGSTPRDEK